MFHGNAPVLSAFRSLGVRFRWFNWTKENYHKRRAPSPSQTMRITMPTERAEEIGIVLAPSSSNLNGD